jgi:N-acetylglucosaminyldiphosphoundecaprenol N-acetyl-beta-D-mannosaminyltransferase
VNIVSEEQRDPLIEAAMEGKRNRIQFGHAVVDVITKREVLAHAQGFLQGNRAEPVVIATVNAQFVHLAGRQPRFAAFLQRADLCVADGMPLVIASRLLGSRLPERITGVDLAEDLGALLGNLGGSLYLLGGRAGAAATTARELQGRYPNIKIAGVDCPPPGFEKLPLEVAAVVEKIQAARPDLLFVCLGAPKQEYWIEENLLKLPCKLVIGLGSTFDVLSGQMGRAPVWMQEHCLEWFFRACSEPNRLGWRYLTGNSYLFWIVLCQVVARAFHGDRTAEDEAKQ